MTNSSPFRIFDWRGGVDDGSRKEDDTDTTTVVAVEEADYAMATYRSLHHRTVNSMDGRVHANHNGVRGGFGRGGGGGNGRDTYANRKLPT